MFDEKQLELIKETLGEKWHQHLIDAYGKKYTLENLLSVIKGIVISESDERQQLKVVVGDQKVIVKGVRNLTEALLAMQALIPSVET